MLPEALQPREGRGGGAYEQPPKKYEKKIDESTFEPLFTFFSEIFGGKNALSKSSKKAFHPASIFFEIAPIESSR